MLGRAVFLEVGIRRKKRLLLFRIQSDGLLDGHGCFQVVENGFDFCFGGPTLVDVPDRPVEFLVGDDDRTLLPSVQFARRLAEQALETGDVDSVFSESQDDQRISVRG